MPPRAPRAVELLKANHQFQEHAMREVDAMEERLRIMERRQDVVRPGVAG